MRLRLGKGIGALLLDRILGGQDEERLLQRKRLLSEGHLALLHGFEQGGLDLGRGAVDLIGEDEVAEHGAPFDRVGALLGIEDLRAGDVAREHVRGELNTGKAGFDGVGQRAHCQRLGKPRHSLQQHVAAGEKAEQEAVNHVVLAHHDLADFGAESVEPLLELVGSFSGGFRSHVVLLSCS
jgi:hypothetical protein